MQNQKGDQSIYRFKDSKLSLKKNELIRTDQPHDLEWDYWEMCFNIGLSSVQLSRSVVSDCL